MPNFKDILSIGLFILSSTYAVEYNIALNKAVTTGTNIPDHLATMAIDQDLNTYVQVNPGNFYGTWIQFDLKGVYNITKIIIWPINDDNDYFLARIYSFVRLTNNTAYDPNDVFCLYDRPVKGVSYNCSKNNNVVKGRYVLLKKESSCTTEILKIAEVAILTEDKDFIVAITGQVEQNHVYNNVSHNDASKAIDENLLTSIDTTQETVANIITPGWWRADLGDSYQVSAVNINEIYISQLYRGYYSFYVDSSGFTKQQLCLFFNQSFYPVNSFFQLKCDSVLTGRYLTVEKISSAYRPDVLSFSEIQVVAVHKGPIYTLPNYYNNNLSTTPWTFNTPTSLNITTSSNITETCSNDCYSCQQKMEKDKLLVSCQTDKIVIGVVVGFISAILFAILGFVSGYVCHKKRNVKPTEATIYESTKVNKEQHIYSDLNNTPMQEIDPYYNENK